MLYVMLCIWAEKEITEKWQEQPQYSFNNICTWRVLTVLFGSGFIYFLMVGLKPSLLCHQGLFLSNLPAHFYAIVTINLYA